MSEAKKPVRILVVDDEERNRRLLAAILETEGYTALEAADGTQALELARQNPPDLVLLDIMMPGMDGYEVARALKADAATQAIPIVMVTALDDRESRLRGLEAGAEEFVTKPVDRNELRVRVRNLLRLKEFSDQLEQLVAERTTKLEAEIVERKRIEKEQARLVAIIEATPDFIGTSTPDGHVLFVNQAGLGMLGYDAGEDTTALRIADAQPEWAAKLVAEQAIPHAVEHGSWSGETALLRRDGREISVSQVIIAHKGASGSVEYLSTIARDITQRKLAEETLKRSQALLNETGKLANVGGWELYIDTKEVVWTEEVYRIHEVELTYKPTLSNAIDFYAPSSRPIIEQAVQCAIEHGKPFNVELEIITAKGNRRWVRAVGKADREHCRVHGAFQDITERKQAEAQLNESNERLRQISENIHEVFWMTDAVKGEMLYISPAYEAIWGRTVDALYASPQDWIDAIHVDDRQRILQAALTKQAAGLYDEEYRIVRPDGSIRWIHDRASPVRSSNGEVYRVVGVAEDITLRKEHEKHIIRLNRVYAVLSGINTTIVRTRDRQELFDEACRIAVELGQFRLAWIGLVDANGLDVTPVARAGVDEGYLDNIQLTARDDTPDRCELVARALREKTVVVCNDIDTDPQMQRWREEALRRGYRSVVVFPLQLGDKVMGLLLLYASEAGFFDAEEMRLLTEIAGDISFALDHLDKEDRLDYLAYYDAVTGLPNRSLLHVRLDQRVVAARGEKKSIAVIVLNLERFRNVNDTLGQSAGDALLRQVARLLRDGLDESDILGHLGADSFVIVAGGCDDESSFGHIVERVMSCIHGQPFEIDGQELRVAAKAGVAIFPHDGADADTLSRNAEAALGKAKLSGDKYLFYAPEFNARVAEKLALENKLRRAVERGELVLHYQPKVELKKRRISGLEALMRWNDPDTGLFVPPVKFIPILEETGLILEAGRWALQQAIADSARWRGKRLQVPRIAVNVSAIQLRQKDFVATVESVLGDTKGIDGILELEITEGLIMQDIDANIRKLQAIRDMGVEIAVDDFGTGYSSLSYISRLPINTLKIDRAFIMNMTSKPDDLSIVSTIISLGHSLELKVVAEGVETEEQANLLRLLKCDEFQGYLFSRPVSVEEIDLLLAEGQASAT